MTSERDRLRDQPPEYTRRSAIVWSAFLVARDAHEGQERKDPGSPYVVHPVLVAERLAVRGYDDDVIVAALLHDVVEDTGLSAAEIGRRFGPRVESMVEVLTDDPGIESFEQSKAVQRRAIAEASVELQAIFAADRTSNAREMARLLSAHGESAAARDKTDPRTRLRLWEADLEMLELRAPDLDLLPELREAVAEFRRAVAALPPGKET